MRQVLVKKHKVLEAMSGDEVLLRAKEFGIDTISVNLSVYKCKFAVNTLNGDFKLKFELPRFLAQQGVILHGAYWEDGEIIAAISTLGGRFDLKKDDVLLVGKLYEQVRFRQIDSFIPMEDLPPTMVRKARKPKK